MAKGIAYSFLVWGLMVQLDSALSQPGQARAVLDAFMRALITHDTDIEAQFVERSTVSLFQRFYRSAAQSNDCEITQFDTFVMHGQDSDFKTYKINTASEGTDRATFGVSFVNFKVPQSVALTLVKRSAGWKVYDACDVKANLCFRAWTEKMQGCKR